MFRWWSILDSNQWPPQCQCGALANWANRPLDFLILFRIVLRFCLGYRKETMKSKGAICFVWWGSGGHVQPIASLIEYGQKDRDIADKCNKIYRFGEKNGLEYSACKVLDWVNFVSILSGKLRRERSLRSFVRNIRDVCRTLWWLFQSVRYLKRYSIDVVFCKWWYVAVPVILAAKILWAKIVVHESDMHPGLANRLAARWATKVYAGFDGVVDKAEVVWQILSDRLSQFASSGLSKTTIDKDVTHILVMWWSQWSASIFSALLALLSSQKFDSMSFHVVLWTKNSDFRKEFYDYANVTCYDFLAQEDLAWLYSICDLSLSRGSATSLAEQQLFWVKKMIIPLPWTGWDHQTKNAQRYVQQHKDMYIAQDDTMLPLLVRYLTKLQWYKKSWKWFDESILSHAKKEIWKYLSM